MYFRVKLQNFLETVMLIFIRISNLSFSKVRHHRKGEFLTDRQAGNNPSLLFKWGGGDSNVPHNSENVNNSNVYNHFKYIQFEFIFQIFFYF